MPQEYPHLADLHRLLAYRPERTELAVTVAKTDRNLLVSVDNGAPVKLPLPEAMTRSLDLSLLLACYPVPATINGAPVTRTASPASANIDHYGYEGDLQDARLTRAAIGARSPIRNSILLDGLLYALGHCPELVYNHAYHQAISYAAPDRRDQRPHYARARTYTIHPNYHWNSDGETDRFDFRTDGERISCGPPLAVYTRLQEQRQRQEAEAARIIKETTGAADLGEPKPCSRDPYFLPDPDQYQSYSDNSAGIIPYRPAVLINHGKLPAPVAFVIARTLYQAPDADLVPVSMDFPSWKPTPQLLCDSVTIVDRKGRSQTCRLGAGYDGYWPQEPNSEMPPSARVRSITAHLTIAHRDGQRETLDLPMDIFCNGERYQEAVYHTKSWTPKRVAELNELLQRCYGYRDNDDENPEQAEEDYRAHALMLATGLLRGDTAARKVQLQNVCDDLFPVGKFGPGAPGVVAGNDRQRLILLPPPGDPDPDDPTETGFFYLTLSPEQFRDARAVLAAVGVRLEYDCEFELGQKQETHLSLGTVRDIILPQVENELPDGQELVEDISAADLRGLMQHYANNRMWTENREVDADDFAERFPHLVTP